jgi:hypothetical protein
MYGAVLICCMLLAGFVRSIMHCFYFLKLSNLLPIYLKGKYRNSRPKMNVYNTMKIA